MHRRSFLFGLPPALLLPFNVEAGSGFPSVSAIPEPHFPNRLYQFVWRNWELANLDRMAEVVRARPEQLQALARELGLPVKRTHSDDYLKRIYISVIRQNWHLLPEEQIIQLLGWSPSHFTFTLKEDDFLDHKLGKVKPVCEPLHYRQPSEMEQLRAREIRAVLQRVVPGGVRDLGQPRFTFIDPLSRVDPGPGWQVTAPPEDIALQAAAKRFETGRPSGSEVRISIRDDAALASGDFEILPDGERNATILASTTQAAIRGLYALKAAASWPQQRVVSKERWPHRFLYSYFALYGDPLMEIDAAALTDGYLDRAAASGMNGVWIQGILNTLAPSKAFPEFGDGWQTRLKNLRELVRRTATFGMRVYLYLNEPRAMPDSFFQNRSGLRGTKHGDLYAMCTSTEQVRDWLRDSISHVFREVPELGGLFTITMSENHTNCFSHGGAWGDRDPVAKDCPRCSQRTGADTIAEFVQTLRDGVRQHSKTAEVMSYDWGWGTPMAQSLIPKLPKDTSVISISEWSQPVARGGIRTQVGEYSMSVVGPGPRATSNWNLAQQHGIAGIAKTQFNNTWEISAVPYIPVMPLVLEHAENLTRAGVSGVMASWTCGGYPSSNLRAATAYAFEPRPAMQEALHMEAIRIYGADNAERAVRAWRIFSDAFLLFPYGVSIYVLPLQHGPANPLRLRPTGLAPGMILFPYDAYASWKGAYPPNVVQELLARLSARWKEGLAILETLDVDGRDDARLELAVARTCHTHFESVANQLEFYLLRDEAPKAEAHRQDAIRRRMVELATRERELAVLQYQVTRDESLIGYEASNHYYYTPVDLLEKVLNCDQVIAELKAGASIGIPG